MLSRYYHILGIPKNADIEEVKRAFRKLALEHHPDRGGDEEKFKKINEAYQVIIKKITNNEGKSKPKSEKYFEIKDLDINQFRSILNILVYFGNIDGYVSEYEKNVIRKFIEQYSFKVNLEDFIEKTISRIQKKDNSEFLNTLHKDLDKLDNLIIDDKRKIVSLLNMLIHSDGENTPEEQWILSCVLSYWQIFGDNTSKEEFPFIFPDKPISFGKLNITVGNLQKLFEMGYTVVVFSEVFSAIIYSQKKSSGVYLIPPNKYPFDEMIGPTFFTLIFGWWSISGFFFTIGSLLSNIIGGRDVSYEIAKQNNIAYNSKWKLKNKGGEYFILILAAIFIGWIAIANSLDTPSGNNNINIQNYNNAENQQLDNKNSYHLEKCGQGKCELNGKCYILPENAICEDEGNLQRKDAWKCVSDSIAYNGTCFGSRFENGKIISKNTSYFNGGHQITINNQGGSSDALIKIVNQNNNSAIISFYVRQGHSFTVKNIKNGNYDVYFKYFDYKNGALENLGAQKMERTGELYSSIEGNYISYASWEITIYPVINGNAQTDDVATDTFDSL